MKNYAYFLMLCIVPSSNIQLNAADHSTWFYAVSPYRDANECQERDEWERAIELYKKAEKQQDFLCTEDDVFRFIGELNRGTTEYNYHMGRLNQAICEMARTNSSPDWQSLDFLRKIPLEKRISSGMINTHDLLAKKKVLVRTDGITINELFYFLNAIQQLRNRAKCYVMLSIKSSLRPVLEAFAGNWSFSLIDEEDVDEETVGYITHLVSLVGYLNLSPIELMPEEEISFEVPQEAKDFVDGDLKQFLSCHKHIKRLLLVIPDRDKHVTSIGGRKDCARSLTLEPFKELLREHINLGVIHYKRPKEKDFFDTEDERYIHGVFSCEEKKMAFDRLIALADYMNVHQNMRAFCCNGDESAVLLRYLKPDAQKRVTVYIENSADRNPLLAGNGNAYQHPTSNARVSCGEITLRNQIIGSIFLPRPCNDVMKIEHI